MTIRQKLFCPIFGAILVLFALGYAVLNWQFNHLKDELVWRMATEKQTQLQQSIRFAARQALEKASLFTRMPQVISAFEAAHTGDINDESDPTLQAAREKLRHTLKPIMEGYSSILNNEKIKLHFHLPNGRSLVRMWRDKQIMRDGRWQDLSDDISGFRNTVLDTNRLGIGIEGIELGRGGFVIRGLAPVKNAAGQVLGSVEILYDFNPLLKSIFLDKQQNYLLYMNKDLLHITHRLQDPGKYPVRDDKYVRVLGENIEQMQTFFATEFIDQGRQELVIAHDGDWAVSAFPIRDYRERQIGVIVIGLQTHEEQQVINRINWLQSAMVLAIVIFISLIGSLILSRTVLTPINKIKAFSNKMASGELTHAIEVKSGDEIGQLAATLNQTVNHVGQMVRDIASGVNQLTSSTDEITRSLEDQATIASEQSASVSQITATMAQFSASSMQIAENSQTVLSIAEQALAHIQEGAVSIDSVMEKMNEIHADNQRITQDMLDLGQKANEINKIMEIINNIADKTTLIAFNAALEASSAGEAGKRFGVVAAEIRRLASSVTESTQEIENRIVEIQTAVNKTVLSIEKSGHEIDAGLHYSGQANDKLKHIIETSRQTRDTAKQISISTQQQKTASDQVVTALQEIDAGGKQSNSAIAQISMTSKSFRSLAQSLKQMVAHFKV